MQKPNQAQRVADKFGGAGSLAEAIDVPYHQVADWCRRTGFVPEKHRLSVLQAAQARGIDLTAFEFVRHLVEVPTGAASNG